MSVSHMRHAAEQTELRRFRDEDGRTLLDLSDAPLPEPGTPAPVRLLPAWDAILLVHARRTGILPEEYRPLIFNTRTPHSMNTFLIDGRVAGTWRYEEGEIQPSALRRLERREQRELEDEAHALGEFHRD